MKAPERMPETARHISLDEDLVFERGAPGRRAFSIPAPDVPVTPVSELFPPELLRDGIEGMPELSEPDVVRHFTRLSTWNYHVDLGLYPLGSCTMKYNPKLNERIARMENFSGLHPYLPEESVQGALEVQKALKECLLEITGMDAMSLQPAAGAQGELTGLLMIRAFHESRKDSRTRVLVPDSSHGTNPASAAIAGYRAEHIRTGPEGRTDLADLEAHLDDTVAGIMITNPNTLGIFESDIVRICELVHSCGGLVYMDGANLNAMLGVARPGDFGVDVLHLNLHKTFSTPHGGGGPGSGPVGVASILEPFLPTPLVARHEDGSCYLDEDRPASIGKIKTFYGHFGIHLRALAYILANGGEGLRETSEAAVLNANYIRRSLEGVYDLPYTAPSLHEVVFSDRLQRAKGVNAGDIAKRLVDYGFHPPTVYFPLNVSGALMIEPTETESRVELDRFVHAMRTIAREATEDPEKVRMAPHATRIGRVDEAGAARKPVLRWQPRRPTPGNDTD